MLIVVHLNLSSLQKGKRITKQVIREHGTWICSLFERLDDSNIVQFESLLSLVWLQTDAGKAAPDGFGASKTKK